MRLIDADALKKPIYAEDDNITGSGMTYAEMDGYNDGIDAAWSRIENAPTIDAVPVVRCKDCKNWNLEHISCEGYARCLTGESGVRYRKKNDFCSHGKRKGGE